MIKVLLTQLYHVFTNEYLQNTETFQLFTMNIQTECVYKIIKNAKIEGLGEKTC